MIKRMQMAGKSVNDVMFKELLEKRRKSQIVPDVAARKGIEKQLKFLFTEGYEAYARNKVKELLSALPEWDVSLKESLLALKESFEKEGKK